MMFSSLLGIYSLINITPFWNLAEIQCSKQVPQQLAGRSDVSLSRKFLQIIPNIFG